MGKNNNSFILSHSFAKNNNSMFSTYHINKKLVHPLIFFVAPIMSMISCKADKEMVIEPFWGLNYNYPEVKILPKNGAGELGTYIGKRYLVEHYIPNAKCDSIIDDFTCKILDTTSTDIQQIDINFYKKDAQMNNDEVSKSVSYFSEIGHSKNVIFRYYFFLGRKKGIRENGNFGNVKFDCTLIN